MTKGSGCGGGRQRAGLRLQGGRPCTRSCTGFWGTVSVTAHCHVSDREVRRQTSLVTLQCAERTEVYMHNIWVMALRH